MDSGEQPVFGEISGAEQKPVARWRWWFHLCVLVLFPLFAAFTGIYLSRGDKPLMPSSVRGLLLASVYELGYFLVLFLVAWLGSRVNGTQLLLRWRGGELAFVLGFAYSIALRIIVMLVGIAVVMVWLLALAMKNGLQNATNPKSIEHLRPTTEHLINMHALTQNPVYFALCLTLLSFVVAAFREELWRSAMFAGINALFPKQFANWYGKSVGILVVAVLFGIGHTAQGIAGVGIGLFLGIGLGVIILAHRSIWPAVIAHGFFDATTFALLYFLLKYMPGAVPGI